MCGLMRMSVSILMRLSKDRTDRLNCRGYSAGQTAVKYYVQ